VYVCSLADACAGVLAMCTVVECHAKLKGFSLNLIREGRRVTVYILGKGFKVESEDSSTACIPVRN
jgi:hypothetical protein